MSYSIKTYLPRNDMRRRQAKLLCDELNNHITTNNISDNLDLVCELLNAKCDSGTQADLHLAVHIEPEVIQ